MKPLAPFTILALLSAMLQAGDERAVGSWRVQTGATWQDVGHAGQTGYLAVRHCKLPDEQFIVRAPEYANLYESVLLVPAKWEWTDAMTLRMTWIAPLSVRRKHQVERSAIFRFGSDYIDIVATVRNGTNRAWNSERYDMFDVMSRNAPQFRHDPAGRRTFVYRTDQFVPVGTFPFRNLAKTLTGSLSFARAATKPGPLELTERLMAKVSVDGEWVLGIASDNAMGVSFNLNPGTACIHQNPHWGRLKAGERRSTHVRVYLLNSSLDKLLSRYRADFRGTDDGQSGQAHSGLQQLWRTALGLDSPTNVIVGRLHDAARLSVQGTDTRDQQGATVESLDATGRIVWRSSTGAGSEVGAYLHWLRATKGRDALVTYSSVSNAHKAAPGRVHFLNATNGKSVHNISNVTHFGNNNSIVADLNNDGREEFLYADLSTLTCYEQPGFASKWRFDEGVRFCWSLPALVKSDQDKRRAIVFGSEYNDQGHKSSMLAISSSGRLLWRNDGHEEDLGSTPVFAADIDCDGKTELLKVGLDLEHRRNLKWNHLHVFSMNGELKSEVALGFTGIAIGDVDSDRHLDGVGLSNTRDGGRNGRREIRCVDLVTGNVKWTIPVQRAYLDTNSPIMADINGDGRLEVIVGTGNPAGYGRLPNSEPWGDLYVISDDGRLIQHIALPGWPVNLAMCDITNDGLNEMLVVIDGLPGSLDAYRTKAPATRVDWPTPFGSARRDGTMGWTKRP